MLMETYLANLRNLPDGVLRVRVARPSVLSPSKELLGDWKAGRIIWAEYEKRFRAEILGNPRAVARLGQLKRLAESGDVYLYCYEKEYPCHRFILLDLVKEV